MTRLLPIEMDVTFFVMWKGRCMAVQAKVEVDAVINEGRQISRLRGGWQLLGEEIAAWNGRSKRFFNPRDFLSSRQWAYKTTLYRAHRTTDGTCWNFDLHELQDDVTKLLPDLCCCGAEAEKINLVTTEWDGIFSFG